MNTLYITNCCDILSSYKDASVRYRCYNPAEALSNLHHLVDVIPINHLSIEIINRYDVFVFHRPSFTKKLSKIVNKAIRLNRVLIADYDDLIFNPDYAAFSPGFVNKQYSLPAMEKEYRKYYDALNLFDCFSVSTRPLADEIKKIKPLTRTGVIHNFISDAWLDCFRPERKKSNGTCRITYLPGSKSHDKDFALVEDVLSAYMEHNQRAILRIIGPLSLNENKFNKDQLEVMGRVPYFQLPHLISESRFTIAPLEPTVFNHCKSGLKFFESAAWGIPVIASSMDDMHRFKTKALLLADSADEWEKAIHLLAEEEYYEKCTGEGAEYVQKHCRISRHIEKLVKFLENSAENKL